MALSCLFSVGLVFDPGPNARSGGATARLERERISRESLENLLRLRLECRAMVAMIASRP